MKRHKSAKSLSGWLNIAKDGVAEDKSSRNTKRQTAKRKEHSSVGWKTERHVANNSGDVPWCVKHAPTDDMSLLAVHKKKIQEVQQWIQFALSKTAKHPILLLTGPSGCGKTATIQALSKQLSYEIIEWNDPIDSRPRIEDNSRTLTEGSYSGINWELYESQTNKFLNFLKRANRYPSLQLVGGGVANKHREGGVAANYGNCKIVLIEELPNVFVRDPKKLHQLLKSVLYGFLYPLVFIVSESQHSRSSLFPPSIIQDLDIHHIHFNPIARTSTVKVLQRIIDSEQIDSVNKSILDGIADCCIGDIRAAINILQFTSTTGSVSGDMWMECDTNGINDKDRNTQLVGVAGREHPLFLFRALGKILYPKRDNTAIIRTLPPHLSHLERPQLLTNPEEVYESAHLSTDFFSSYLHQNYIDFFNDIDDLVWEQLIIGEECTSLLWTPSGQDLAIGYLSDSDVIGHAWNDVMDKHRSLATSCSCSVACRGLIFANQQTLSSKWRPMYKPQWTTVYQQYINNTQTARDLFVHLSGFAHSHLWMPIDLLTELLPYMAFNSVPLKNHAQISFLHTLTTFKGTHCNQHIEQLGEMEQDDNTLIHSQPGSQTANSIGMSLSQQQTSSQTLTEEDEIEEFDD